MDGFGRLFRSRLLHHSAAPFHFPHRPAVFHRFLRQFQLVDHRQGQQGAGVPHFQVPPVKHVLYRLGQGEQAQAVGYRAAAFAHGFGDCFVRQGKLVGQPFQAARFFYRVEVFALQVFDQTHRQRGFVADVFHHDGDFRQTGQLRRAPAAFAGDQFVLRQAMFAHDNRLDDALRPDGFGQLVQGFVVHLHARLVAAGADVAHGGDGQTVALPVFYAAGKQGIQPAPQSAR